MLSAVYRSEGPAALAGVGEAGVMMGGRGTTVIGTGIVELRAEDVGVGQWIDGRAWCSVATSSSWNEGNDEKEEAEEWWLVVVAEVTVAAAAAAA